MKTLVDAAGPESGNNRRRWTFPDFTALDKEIVVENEIPYTQEGMLGSYRELIAEEHCMWYLGFDVSASTEVAVYNPAPRVQMTFSLQGSTSYFAENLGKVFVSFQPQQHNLMLIPEGEMVIKWTPGSAVEIFVLSLSPEFVFKTLSPSHRLYQHFSKGIEFGMPAFMSLRNLPVTPKMTHVLFDILQCNFSGYHKSLFIKAKVIELLTLQLEQYEQLPVPDITSGMRAEHIDQMHMAKQMLVNNLERNWSLKELAHSVGTNEFNLKKYFKEVFGTTVFGYLHEARMETSRRLLTEPGALIAEVAQRMGYKHPTHFTAAFKKYYGMLPTQLRPRMWHWLQFSEFFLRLFSELAESGGVAVV